MRKIVVIPTYNEVDNVGPLITALLNLGQELDILIVDDNSPDGTGQKVQELQKNHPRLNLLSRPGKGGLAAAYIAGMNWSLERGYDVIVQMDADFSHRPQDLVTMLQKIHDSDGVVGSRYIGGGRTANWGFIRKLISRGGSLYARLILGYPLHDWTGGFNAWKASALRKMNLERITSGGYSFQIELKYRAQRQHCKLSEVPILFEDRRVGQSKMSLAIVLEALYRVWMIRFGTV